MFGVLNPEELVSGARPKVLVVDDAVVMRKIMTKVLETEYEVVGDAGDGKAAFEAVELLRPDIVVMDVTMPILDGIQATRMIHEQFPEIDVVILSGVSNEDSVRAGLAAGARDYLIKPVKSAEILEVLARLVRQRAAPKVSEDAPSALSPEVLGPPGSGIWSFLGAQGGDGRTTLVLALANELLALNQRVVVVDGDFVFGDLCFYLGIEAQGKELAGLLAPTQDRAPEELARSLLTHSSGLRVAGRASDAPPFFESTPLQLMDLVRGLRSIADFVLVDFPTGIPDALLPLIDESRYVFPVASSRPESLRNLHTMIEVLDLVGCHPPRRFPLVTRSHQVIGRGLGVKEVFPEDAQAVDVARQERQAVSQVAPKSLYTQKARDMIRSILQVSGPEPHSAAEKGVFGGFLQRLRGT